MEKTSISMKNVLVTGATSGIGLAACEFLLYKKDYKVVAVGRNVEAVTHLAQNPAFTFIEYDLNDFEKYDQIFADRPKFDGLIHCAGMEETFPLSMYSHENVQRIFDINVFSGIELLRYFSKKKYSNDASSIVFLSSVMAELGQPGKVGYCATKAAVLGAVRSAALELARRRIRVNSVAPGVVMTPMTEKLFAQLDEINIKQITDMHPLGLGKTDDIVPLLEFLISDQSSWITGQNIKIDGGYSVH